MTVRASRMERQVRSQIRGLNGVAWALLLGCMAMTAMFGWGLGRSIAEKMIFAGSLMAVDLAGAIAMKSNGTCSANREGKGVFWSMTAAVICFVITFLGMLGFQSESRETQVASREQAAKIAADYLGWSKNMAVDAALGSQERGKDAPKDKGASARMTMAAGIESVGKVVKDQMAMLQSGEIAAMGDGQAAALARITGLSEATARSWTMMAISAAFLMVQYICQWLAGFMRQRVEPVVAALAYSHVESEDSDHVKFGKFAKSPQFHEARRDVVRMLVMSQPFPPNVELSQRWGVSTTTVCHWLQAFRAEGHEIPMAARGGRRKRLPIHLNGSNGAAIAGNA